jgi:hypothetical protein
LADRNPFFSILWDIVDRYGDSTPVDPDAPDAFRFAPPGKLLKVLTQAGATNVCQRPLHFQIEARVSSEEFWTLRSEMSDNLRSKLASLSAQQVAEIKNHFLKAVRPYSSNSQLIFPAEVLVASCNAP